MTDKTSKMNERKSGYYWVKLKGEWIVAEWAIEFQNWYITARRYAFEDVEFSEIDKKQIERK